MDLRLSALLLMLLLSACSAAQPAQPLAPREYAGILVGNTRWAGEVVLAADVIIPEGSRLTIAPGTRVRVRPSLSTKIEPEQLSAATELLIRGRLDALGSTRQPIEFIIDGPHQDAIAWAGIIADRAEALNVQHVRLERAEQGLWLVASPGRIVHNRIAASRYGMVFQQPAALEVRDNQIVDGEAGLFCWLGASPQLKGNTVRGQTEEGVFIDALSRPRLEDNRILNNGIGLVAADLKLATGNRIEDNGVDLLPLGGQR